MQPLKAAGVYQITPPVGRPAMASFSSTDCGWKDEWAEVRAAREARTASKKNTHKGLGAGAKAAAAAAAVVAAPAKAAAAAAAAEKAAEKAAAKEAAKAAAVVAAAAAATAAAEAEAAKKAAYADGSYVSAPQYQPGDVEVSGCGREGVNGTYRRSGLRDGVPCYKRVGGGRHRPAYTLERTTGDTREWRRTVKVPPWQRPSSAPADPQGRAWRLWAAQHSQAERPGHRAPGHCLGCSSQPPPNSLAELTAFSHPGGACALTMASSRTASSRRTPRCRPPTAGPPLSSARAAHPA